ncbi:Kinesin-like calmodulin-binding protein [Acorus gramineus]|uniref:Kinesin-like calmodulin-binding protein n=1 Tax=Acorus gramineus TaxID=55184 RepID=A0AAV9BR61_ACOGR|nr:Kinesin-like calmodulin-binding protein [Acorus gramineus]
MWKMLLSMEEPPLMKISDPDEIGSNCDPSDGIPVVYTDVNVVPKHEKEGPQQTLADLQDQILASKSKQRFLVAKRREALNKLLDIKGSIRVFCRVRSFLPNDKREIRQTVSTGSEKITIRSTGIKKEFRVDKVFPQEAAQEDVFIEVEPILKSAIDGHNVCIFAYGQTGTGKTFTMEGTKDQPGIVPRAIEELFHHLNPDQSITISMLEVYMGSLKDLLARKPPSNKTVESASKCLSIHTGCNGSLEIEGLTDVVVTDHREAIRWYTKGKRARATSWTNVNEASSRSHCLTRITIFQSGSAEKGKAVVSRLWLVDLGGSERLLKTGAVGLTLDEGRAINLSLSALGDVIAALKMRRKHIPYRNSKLTQILRNSLGEGSKVLMLVHISPSENDVAETICSLNFANRARAVEPNKELSEASHHLCYSCKYLCMQC